MTDRDLLWPQYSAPDDLAAIEAIPLAQRGLPDSTYAVLKRAATLWPDRTAVSVMPDADHWRQPSTRTFSKLLTDVRKSANMLRHKGIEQHDPVALISPNCDELITATLAAQLAGIAAPINGGLSGEHIGHLVERSGARVLVAPSPELDEASWRIAQHLAGTGVIDTVLLLCRTADPSGVTPPLTIAGATVAYLSELAQTYDGSHFSGEPPAADDLAAMFHTGGTTGKPKPAAHTHANEVADAWMIAANTATIEDALLAGPDVTAAAVVGRPDIHAGEVPVAYVTVAPRASATEQQLRAWAGDHVAERAAAPELVTILDALPVTAVGKPFKLPLRADATRRAVQDALADVRGIEGVDATVDDGSVIVTVTLTASGDESSARNTLERVAIAWHIKVGS